MKSQDMHSEQGHPTDTETTLALLQATVEAVADGVLTIDNEGAIVSYNKKFVDLWRVPPSIMIEGTFEAHIISYLKRLLVRPEDLPTTTTQRVDFRQAETSGTLETTDGRFINFFAQDQVQEGTVIGRVWSFHDATDQIKAEQRAYALMEELKRSNQDLEQFAYVASHDLQEPLRAVTGSVQLLARRYKGKLDPEADEFIGFAVDGTRRMKTLIVDLLAYSRVSTRGGSFAPISTEKVLAQALVNLSAAIEQNDAKVAHDQLPVVFGDAGQLALVFQNLISNAIKFRQDAKPPTIYISTQYLADQNMWQFAVRDNGIGIEKQYADRVFVVFQRLHTIDEYPGTGMGLALCKKIVTRHGGRIWVDSTPGEGSTFYFTLPSVEESTQS